MEALGGRLVGARALGRLSGRLRGCPDPLQHIEAPWYVVPADSKSYRNYIVARTIAERLKPYEHAWERTLTDMGKERRQELQAAQIPEREASIEANT